ncbi:MAG: ATP-binding cassette domain-containing protein [Saprospiraceae bacterium]|nr:ATP-binding cassette domain-containing protein [Saprospiraceae bacterium]MCB9326500.1 ATP-binding cassette domain-containing protein [Lewinellaceae bacterium]
MPTILEINNLTKQFGRLTAVNHLSLNIEKGSVFGMLGPNGSGKTTTLGMLLGVTKPTSGTFSWFGKGESHEMRKNIGAILEQPVFYPYMTGIQNLGLVCQIKGAEKNRIEEVLEIVGLSGRGHDKFKGYSLGMKQRLAIAAALINDPEVLVLDEPTNGLDPQGIFDIRQLIRQIAQTGKTIILASHLLDEVQKVCTDFCVLQTGNLIYQGIVEADFAKSTTIELVAEDMQTLIEALQKIPGVDEIEEKDGKVIVRGTLQLNSLTINKYLVEKGIVLTHLHTLKKSLEEQFMEILSEEALGH